MKCVTIKTLEGVENAVSYIRKRNLMYSIDLETTGVNPYTNQIVGVGVSIDGTGGFYVPIRHRYDQPFEGASAVEIFRPLFRDYQFCAFNANFELEFLEHDWKLIPNIAPVDASLLTYTAGVWDFQKLSLVSEDLCPQIEVMDFKEFMLSAGLHPEKNTIDEAPVDKVAEYCVKDTTACMIAYNKLYDKLHNHPIYKLERAVMPVVKKMRANGILISPERVKAEEERLREELAKLQTVIESQVAEKAGEAVSFNIGSGKQLGNVLYDILGFTCERYTDKGARKTDKETLGNLKWKHPIVRNIIAHKEISKLVSTYYVKYLNHAEEDGRIHTSFNQTGAPTGRFSSNDPNLQNTPRPNTWTIETKKGNYEVKANFRKCFIAPEDYWFLELDYSQIEARLMAGVTKDPVLVNAFANDIDYHTKTASEVFGVKVPQVDKEKRYMGKLLNFALGYGMGENLLYYTLRKDIDITFDQSCHMRKQYLKTYETMFSVAEGISLQARKEKKVMTLWGRQVPINTYYEAQQYAHCTTESDRRKYHKLMGDADRKSYNAVIQGSAADLIKMALYKCDKKIEEKYVGDVQMISTVHDSIGFYIKKTVDVTEFIADMLRCMFVQMDGFPPFIAEVSMGESWGALKEPEKGQKVGDFVQGLSDSIKGEQGDVVNEEHTFILEIEDGASYSLGEVNSLRTLLRENPGHNRVILKEATKETELPFKTALGLEDKEKITFVFGGKFYERL